MAKNPPKSTPTDDTNQPDVTGADNAPAAERTYPWTGKAVNNTPIPIYLSEAGVSLAANYHAPANEGVVTYQSADHFTREMANIEAIESVHNFVDAVIFSDPAEPESSGEEANK